MVLLHEAKAELFRTLGHPTRIRILEMLLDGSRPVHELRAEIEIEPSSLSQQLAVLRRSGLVVSTRSGATVLYTISTPEVAELMVAARHVLATVLAGRQQLLAELQDPSEPVLDQLNNRI